MHSNFTGACCVLAVHLLSACAGSTPGAQPDRSNPESTPLTPNFGMTTAASSEPTPDINTSRFGRLALSYVEQHAAGIRLQQPQAELTFQSESIDAMGQRHVRFQQVHSGVPVWGRQLIVHLDAPNTTGSHSGELLTDLGRVDTHANLTPQAAMVAAQQTLADGQSAWQTSAPTLYIYPQKLSSRLAYRVTATRGMERWFVFIDAHDGSLIHRSSGMPSQ